MTPCNEDPNCPKRSNPVLKALEAELGEDRPCVFRPIDLEAGRPLFLESLPAHSVFAIRTGSCKGVQIRGQGREHVLRAYGPGDLLGLDVLDLDEYQSSAYAATQVGICHAPRGVLLEAVLKSPEVAEAVVHELSEELHGGWRLLASLGCPRALGRVARLLLDQRKGEMEHGVELVELPLNRKDTAAMLGMAEESLSRQLTNLEKCGAVRRRGRRLLLTDLSQIRRFAEE